MHERLTPFVKQLRRGMTIAGGYCRQGFDIGKIIAARCFRQLCLASRIGWQKLKKISAIAAQKTSRISRHCYAFARAHWPTVSERLDEYILLTRLNKPIGILLLLWPTLWALWIAADGVPDYYILLVFISGVVLMRSAGCVINDIADRNLDLHVRRTKERPITTGRVSVKEALLVALVLVVTAFGLVLTLNDLTIRLSFIALGLAIIYPFMKRYTYLPQLFLGLAFAWAIPMAFAAQTNQLPIITWLLLVAAVLWTMVYDTQYAMADREDDIKVGIKSMAVLFDDADRLIIGIIQLLVLCSLLFVGSRAGLGHAYYAGLAIAALFSAYQQYLIKDRIPQRCLRAFLNNHWFGATVFIAICLHYLQMNG